MTAAPDLTPTAEERRLAYGVAMARQAAASFAPAFYVPNWLNATYPWPRVTRRGLMERVPFTVNSWTYRSPTTLYEVRYDLATDDATLHAVEVEVTVPPAMSSESARAITDSLAVRLDQFLHSGHYPEHLRALSEAIDALRAISEATVPPVVTPLPYPYCHVCFARDRRYTLAMRTRDGSPMCDLHWQEDQSAPVVPRAYRVAAQIVETLDDACNGETLTKDGSLAYSAAYQHDNTRLSIRAALHVARERAEASVTEDGT